MKPKEFDSLFNRWTALIGSYSKEVREEAQKEVDRLIPVERRLDLEDTLQAGLLSEAGLTPSEELEAKGREAEALYEAEKAQPHSLYNRWLKIAENPFLKYRTWDALKKSGLSNAVILAMGPEARAKRLASEGIEPENEGHGSKERQ